MFIVNSNPEEIRRAFVDSEELHELFDIAKQDIPQRWNAWRKIHAVLDKGGARDPYILNWSQIFTPIEAIAWAEFRYRGLVPRCQYPVGPYFVDFAFPEKKIAFECDGKNWHEAEKDRVRDMDLARLGWKTFRATGAECKRYREAPWEKNETMDEQLSDMDNGLEWLNRTSDGLIYAIHRYYFCDTPIAEPFTKEQVLSRLFMASRGSVI